MRQFCNQCKIKMYFEKSHRESTYLHFLLNLKCVVSNYDPQKYEEE